jgi:hypothetical protein
MSRQLLQNLNGNKTGQLKKFLDDFKGEPRIAWYPSAGDDFRPLLYLHPKFSELNPASRQEPQPPDIFLFTDYYPWQTSNFLDSKKIYSTNKTTVLIEHIEELPRLNLLPLHKELVQIPEGSSATDKAVFLKITIESDRLGSISYPVVYAFAENETFYCKKIIPHNAIIPHIIHIRYGGGCGGGGWAKGAWLLNVFKKLHTELFITDGRLSWQTGDEFALKFCSSIPRENDARFIQIREQRNGWATLSSGEGNYHRPTMDILVKDGHVNWYLVR